MSREESIQDAWRHAVEKAVKAGSDKKSVSIVSVEDIPLAYLPGNALLIRVKAVGELKSTNQQCPILF
ncbi:hypothetical protein [Peribacillus frigoritolerans]|uniref:hypothetical protein n=1 Tax=Peribacillus frigoritolerans TaxID=450367 RepID=UPI0032E496B0